MSDEAITDPTDSPAMDPKIEGDGAAPAQADSAEALAAMEKRFLDTQAKLTEMGQSNAELKGAVDTLKAVAGRPSESVVTPEQEDARLEKLEEETGLSKAALVLIGNQMADANDARETKYQAELKALRDEGTERETRLQGFIEAQDPAYQNDREKIDEIVEKTGVTRQQAIIMRSLVPSGPVVEAGSPSPGSMGSPSVAPSKGDAGQSSAEVMAAFDREWPDATPEERAKALKQGVGIQTNEWRMPGGGA
jgi:hypothetical protein